MNHLYWVGVRKSDLLSVDSLYEGSITLFGDGKGKNISLFGTGISRKNHNIESPVFLEFYKMAILQILNENPDAKFMFYNPIIAYSLERRLREKVICLNGFDILKVIDDKMLCRLWLKNTVQLLESAQLFGKEISLAHLDNIMGKGDEYILQLPISSGGTGTYILNRQNYDRVTKELLPDKLYTISPYYPDAIPVNVHCIIYEHAFKIYPFSIQIISKESGNLIYKGCDFISAQKLNDNISSQLLCQASDICQKLCDNNYRGVCGIDFMLIDGQIFFCEINPRFQASTMVLNLALVQNGFSSINKETIYAFTDEYMTTMELPNLSVGYSSYAYEENGKYTDFHNNLFQQYFSMHSRYEILKDGYTLNADTEQGAYLFRVIFPHPLVNLRDGKIHMDELLTGYILENPVEIIYLKIMLLNFGVKIPSNVLSYIQKKGNLREANFSAIDIVLKNGLIINCPYNIRHSVYSPFSINLYNKQLTLYYFNKRIIDVEIYYESKLNGKKTLRGISYSSVAFLATDRLRINYNSVCYYKKNKCGCKFCNLPDCNESYQFEDITEIIDDFLKNEDFRHILLGGGSSDPSSDFHEILKLTAFLKSRTEKPLYLMTIPPKELHIIDELYYAGISEIAFNIEIFDQDTAEHFMPGKGKISRQNYYDALQKAVALWGKNGNVRSMVILGLESEESFLTGIEHLCQIGVQPMISIFRPMEDTPLASRLPLYTRSIYEQYKKAQAICEKYEQVLGPTCIYCQNNTISIPPHLEHQLVTL